MALLLWIIITCFYIYFGLLYLQFSSFAPLGAMVLPDVVNNLVFTYVVGVVSVILSYAYFIRKKKSNFGILNDNNFLSYLSLMYCAFSLGCFIWGVQYYGGYIAFLRTPYIAIFSGNAENGIKDVLISSSGLMAIFSILCAFQVIKVSRISKWILIVSCIVLFSIFVQGRRETLLLLIMTFASYRFLSEKISIKTITKSLLFVFLLFVFAGLGLYLRASSETSGGSFLSAIINAVLFETHFTIANLANEIATHSYNNIPYGGLMFLLYPVFFIVPSFIFSIFGYDKSEVFSFNEPKIYDDKGGSFIFTEAYHSLGNIGVICHGILLGFLIAYFYSSAKASKNIIFHFPLVSLILVASRKDIIYGIKYISLEFILMFVLYLFYILLPKKTTR